MPKTDFMLKIDTNWRVRLIGVDFEAKKIDDLIIDREDGKFFAIRLTKALGYIFPMVFEVLNKQDIAGNICLIVRTSLSGKKYVVVERKKAVNWKGEVEERLRACRSSISSPDGSPIPAGTKKPFIHDLGLVELNDMRIAGPVRSLVIEQSWDQELEPGQELMSFYDFARSKDGPGKTVLFAYEQL